MYKLNQNSIIRLSDNACIPLDPANTDYTEFLKWESEGNTPEPADIPPPPTTDEIIKSFTDAIQARLDTFTQTRGYDGILSACTYGTSTNQKFAAEGAYCVSARDATWAKCYEILSDVQAEVRPMPTLDEIVAELPVLAWPV